MRSDQRSPIQGQAVADQFVENSFKDTEETNQWTQPPVKRENKDTNFSMWPKLRVHILVWICKGVPQNSDSSPLPSPWAISWIPVSRAWEHDFPGADMLNFWWIEKWSFPSNGETHVWVREYGLCLYGCMLSFQTSGQISVHMVFVIINSSGWNVDLSNQNNVIQSSNSIISIISL